MHVVPKHQTSATLFGRDGSVRLFKNLREAFRALGAEFIRHELGPDFKTNRYGRMDFYPSLFQYVMLDDSGKALGIEDFKDLLSPRRVPYWRREPGSYGVKYPGSKSSGYNYWRRPKTIAEQRLHSLVLTEEGEPPVRAGRKPNNLPDTWDDFHRHIEKSWKRFRKTQYKSKGETT